MASPSLSRRIDDPRCREPSRSGRKQPVELAQSARAEQDGAAVLVPARPFEIQDLRQIDRAEAAGEMVAALAPVETAAAREAPLGFQLMDVDAKLRSKAPSGIGEHEHVVAALQKPVAQHALVHLNPARAGQMIVADARLAQRGIAWNSADTPVSGA